jgi:hypothetical protein
LCFDRLMFFCLLFFFSPNPQPSTDDLPSVNQTWLEHPRMNRSFLSMKSLEIIYKRVIWYGFNGILMRILVVNKWMTNQFIHGGCTSQPYLMTAR